MIIFIGNYSPMGRFYWKDNKNKGLGDKNS